MEHQEGLEPRKTKVAASRFVRFGFWCAGMERETGVEPVSSVWRTEALPLDDSLIWSAWEELNPDPLTPRAKGRPVLNFQARCLPWANRRPIIWLQQDVSDPSDINFN
jgi:hypothetical protein